MSHMEGKIDFDLSKGFSWNAVLSLRKSAERRRKVIAELVNPQQPGPSLIVMLDAQDRLAFGIADIEGKTFFTEPAPIENYMGRPIWLRAEAIPAGDQNGLAHVKLALSIHDRTIGEADAIGDFGGVIHGHQTVGAASGGHDPASFDIAELAAYASPLSAADLRQFAAYIKQRYGLEGDQHAK